MPASNVDLCFTENARKTLGNVERATICDNGNANQLKSQFQNIHVSTNFYYGYHDNKSSEKAHATTDCEMLELSHANDITSRQLFSRKRSAGDSEFPQNKRFKEEVQSQENIEPETNEIKNMDKNTEDLLLETLYWNIHGGNMFQLLQCQ